MFNKHLLFCLYFIHIINIQWFGYFVGFYIIRIVWSRLHENVNKIDEKHKNIISLNILSLLCMIL